MMVIAAWLWFSPGRRKRHSTPSSNRGWPGVAAPTSRQPASGKAASPRASRATIVNAEEGEPGVFKDRHLLESDPHRVIEGMLIAAYTMGASRVVVYVNGQATLARERLTAAR